METQTSITTTSTTQLDSKSEFSPGATVVYALHGRCTVLAVETRQIGNETIRFYKLEVQKSALSRSTRQEPAIWLPVNTAKERGLRAPMTRADADLAIATLNTREYYFQTAESWTLVHPKLEACIRGEGGVGLAKVTSYLYVLKKKQIVPSSEVARFDETVTKILFRELSEVFGEPVRSIEERAAKGLRHKMAPDN